MSAPARLQARSVPWSNLLTRFDNDIDQLERLFFNNFRPSGPTPPASWPPARLGAITALAIDVFEKGDEVVVKAEIPGVKKDDIEVNVADSMLTVSGSKERSDEVKDESYYQYERSHGVFSRTVELPSEVQATRAKASFTDGVLEIRLPKTDEARKKAVKLEIT